jgi:rSAM/selenodomain-associated transferase 1
MKVKDKLLVFARYPELGKVKTRLAADIGAAEALRVYEQLLAHTHSVVQQISASRTLWLAAEPPTGSTPLWPDAEQLVQPTHNDLGARMQHAFEEAFTQGAKRAVVIGTDCPGLQPEHLQQAFAQLESHDVVLGPAEDGGYYLLGMRTLQQPLFTGITWSTNTVLTDTLAIAQRQGLSVALLPTLHDIDNGADLATWRQGAMI